MARFRISNLTTLESLPCPCGTTQRAFVEDADQTASVHLVEISKETRLHYHKTLTEIYVILQGTGFLELDGERVPVQPLTAVKILPGCVHRAVGDLQILNIAIPAFNAEDEWDVAETG